MEDPRSRRITSVQQLELLLNFLEHHKDLALGRVRSKEARALTIRLWEQCALTLNSEGPFRDAKEWSRFWNDYKSRVRAKLIIINRSQTGTGGGPPSPIVLTPIEQRVAGLIGHDVGPIPGVQQDPFYSIDNNESEHEEIQPPQQQEFIFAPSTSQSSALEIQEEQDAEEVHASESSSSQPPVDTPIRNIRPSNESAPPYVSQSAAGHSSTSSRPRRPRNQTRQRPSLQRSNREALEESRSAIAQIEIMRARTEELLAQSSLRQAEAAVRHEMTMERISDSFQMVAEAIDRISRRHRRRLAPFSSDED